jgi:hypothetical protein
MNHHDYTLPPYTDFLVSFHVHIRSDGLSVHEAVSLHHLRADGLSVVLDQRHITLGAEHAAELLALAGSVASPGGVARWMVELSTVAVAVARGLAALSGGAS